LDFHLFKERVRISTAGHSQTLDVTPDVVSLVKKHGVVDGHVIIFVPGSTAGVTTTEFEPGLLKDLPEALEKIAPAATRYHHDDTLRDGNGHSHIRASLVGPSLTVPIEDGELTLGTWQQIVLIDFDNRPRQRKLVVQIFGTVGG
jgi:secondary thiamine-phosphate synthase enzyme